MTMATSNRERVGQGLELLAAGLWPFVDAAMSAAAPGGQDWVEVLEARDNARHGTAHQYSRTDPRFLLKVLTEEWRVFSKSAVACRAVVRQRAAGDREPVGARRSRSARMTRTGRWTRWSGC